MEMMNEAVFILKYSINTKLINRTRIISINTPCFLDSNKRLKLIILNTTKLAEISLSMNFNSLKFNKKKVAPINKNTYCINT